MLQSDYNVELVWPIRKEYIDSYPGEMYIVIAERGVVPENHYREKVIQFSDLNFYDKIQGCEARLLPAGEQLYYCPSVIRN